MLKYVNTGVVFQEIPDEVTLSINISNCPCRCPGCHSKYLWADIGETLDEQVIDRFAAEYGTDISCICFMGGDADPVRVNMLARYIHQQHPQYKVAWYSGRLRVPSTVCKTDFDYIKIGPYIAHLGALKEPTTNQRLYRREKEAFRDITRRFWNKNTLTGEP
jgi:anaerobic ribonucleoside-triphosphate reductase activating protein